MPSTSKDYSLRTKLDLPYEKAIETVTAALKDEGFGVLTEIDVKATLKEKLNEDYRKYLILGACNPRLAHKALNIEQEIGLLLPCNVIVYEDDGKSVVSIADPVSMFGVYENPDLDAVAEEARSRLMRVIHAVEKA